MGLDLSIQVYDIGSVGQRALKLLAVKVGTQDSAASAISAE